MASEPRALSSYRSNSEHSKVADFTSAYVKSATLLRKEGFNISAEIWSETRLWKQKND